MDSSSTIRKNEFFLQKILTLGNRISINLGSIILSLILGPPGAIFSVYIENQDINNSLTRTIYLFFGTNLPLRQGIIGLVVLSLFLFYLFYMINYLRMKLMNSKDSLLYLLFDKDENFNKIFAVGSQSWPPILIGVLLIIIFTVQSFPEVPRNFTVYYSGLASIIFITISYPIWFIVFSTFAWIYFSSIRGLHQLGSEELRMKSFQEDKMLGVRTIGSLSLSFAFTYFTGLGILALLPLIITPGTPSTGYIWLLMILSFLGIIFFFLPLNTIHVKMIEAKKNEQQKIREKFNNIIKRVEEEKISGNSETNMLSKIDTLLEVLIINITMKESSTIPTWPIDLPILSRFTAMIFSVIAIILANIIMRRFIQFL
jgi:hypothetical protein